MIYFVQFYNTVEQYFCETRPNRVFVTVFSKYRVSCNLLNSILIVKKQISIFYFNFFFLNLVLSIVLNISVCDEDFALVEAVQFTSLISL